MKASSLGELIKACMTDSTQDDSLNVVPVAQSYTITKEDHDTEYLEYIDHKSDFYSELFIGSGSEMLGSTLDDSDFTYGMALVYQFTQEFEMASVFGETDDDVASNYCKIVSKREFDEYKECSNTTSLLDKLDDTELNELTRLTKESTFVCLVNYKGEMEGLGLLNSCKYLYKTFNGKYDYY